MLLAISLFIQNLFGWLTLHWRIVTYALLAGIVLVAVLIIFKSCGKPTPKLDQGEIVKTQQAIANQDRQVLVGVLTNSDVRDKEINGELANAKDAKVNAIADSKAKWDAASDEEIRAEAEARVKQSQ